MEILFLIGRFLYGGFLIKSAWSHFAHNKMLAGYAASKKVPMARLAVFVAGIFLLAGGLGVFLGIYVQWAVLAIVLFFVPVTFTMHRYWKETDPGTRATNSVNFYKNLALLGAGLMLLMIPVPWAWALF